MTTRVLERLQPGARIAVIRLRSLGDCVLTTPALHILKSARPDLEVAVVVEDAFAEVFEGNPDVDRIMLPHTGELARWRPEAALNLHGGTRSSQLTFASRARLRIGFAHFRFKALYNVRIPRAQEILGVERKVHTAEHLASAMFYLGAPMGEIPRARLFARASAVEPETGAHGRGAGLQSCVDSPEHALHATTQPDLRPRRPTWTSAAGLESCPTVNQQPDEFFLGVVNTARTSACATYAVIHAMASAPEKTWPAENFLRVAAHLRRDAGLEPVFIAGPGESLAAFKHYRCISGAPLTEIKALLAGASLFFGNDSGPAHMAAAFGLRCVVLFGPSDAEVWAPWKTEAAVLQSPTIRDIAVEDAIGALTGLPV